MQQTNHALIVVDYQDGFIPKVEWWTWELWVERGWFLAPRINELMKETKTAWGLIIGTRDWHPQWHMSFASNYKNREIFEEIWWEDAVNWIPSKLELSQKAEFNLDDLSAEFWATWKQRLWPDHCVQNTQSAEYFSELDTSLIDRHIWTSLTEILKQAWVETVKLIWLATDYCVESTAVDAVKNWFKAIIDSSAIRWVAVKPEDTIKYLEALREREWVEFVCSIFFFLNKCIYYINKRNYEYTTFI